MRLFSQNPNIVDPEIPPEQFKLMQSSLKAFAQCITLGRYQQAQQVLDEHREAIQKYFPEEHPATYSVVNNQALLYKVRTQTLIYQLNGDFIKAKEMFTIANEKYTKLYGEVHPSTVNSLINLATVHKDLQEFDQAVPLYEKAIEGRKQLEGEGSMNCAMAKAMAAGAYRELGQYDTADKYLKDAYLTVAVAYGEENIQCSVILNSMGLLYKKQGKFERSLDAYTRALKIRETELGEDHPDCIATRHNIAELYIQWVKPEKAQEYIQINIDIMEKQSKEDQAIAKELQKNKQEEDKYF